MDTLSPPPGTSAEADDTLATIKIHDEEFQTVTDFIVPAALATSRSEFCKNALKQRWQRENIQTIHIWNREPKIFALYLQILYGQTLNLQLPERESVTHHAGTDYITLFEIYVLAEFLQDPVTEEILKQYLWDALFAGDYTKRILRSVPCAEVCFVYYGHSSLIRLYDKDKSWTMRYPYPFLKDLTESLMEYRAKPTHGLPHERLETYREDEMGWTRYRGEFVMEAEKVGEPVIDLLV